MKLTDHQLASAKEMFTQVSPEVKETHKQFREKLNQMTEEKHEQRVSKDSSEPCDGNNLHSEAKVGAAEA